MKRSRWDDDDDLDLELLKSVKKEKRSGKSTKIEIIPKYHSYISTLFPSFQSPSSTKHALLSYTNALPPCRSVDTYEPICQLGQGMYGSVYKAKHVETGEIFALKKLFFPPRSIGIPATFLREVNILMQFSHPNLLKIKEIVRGGELKVFYLVMDFIEFDLYSFLQTTTQQHPLLLQEIKTLMFQLFSGLNELHRHNIVHRDLKTSNLLLSSDGNLIIGDFGSARVISTFSATNLTPTVTTAVYRAPEMFMDDSAYTSALDMWACGCILAELVLGRPLFNGHDELRVLANIFNIVGFPTEQSWPGVNSLPGAFILKTQQNQERLPLIKTPTFRLEMMGLTNSGFSLLASLLTLDPKKRITAQQALQHPFFSEEPVGTPSLHLSQSRLKEIRARHGERRRLDEDLTLLHDHNLTLDATPPYPQKDS